MFLKIKAQLKLGAGQEKKMVVHLNISHTRKMLG